MRNRQPMHGHETVSPRFDLLTDKSVQLIRPVNPYHCVNGSHARPIPNLFHHDPDGRSKPRRRTTLRLRTWTTTLSALVMSMLEVGY